MKLAKRTACRFDSLGELLAKCKHRGVAGIRLFLQREIHDRWPFQDEAHREVLGRPTAPPR
jgi:hypothetical protein